MVPDDTKTHAELKTCQTIYVTENQVFAMIDYLIVYKKYNLDGIKWQVNNNNNTLVLMRNREAGL